MIDKNKENQELEKQELEDCIQDWYYGEQSHTFAKALGTYLFQCIDHVYEQGLSERTMSKHIDNCWCIGYLECSYGYRDEFDPGDIFYGPEAGYEYEFKRKISHSKYAINSYRATWGKLYKYTKTLGYIDAT